MVGVSITVMVKRALDQQRTNFKEVRILRDRMTQNSRGLAFVDFRSNDEARRFMRESTGELHVRGVATTLVFGSERDEIEESRPDSVQSATLMFRGVTPLMDERDIRNYLDDNGQSYVDVRVIKDKNSGVARGFGFVEFASVNDARQWMDSQNGVMRVRRTDLRMSYSLSRGPDSVPLTSFGRSSWTSDVSTGDWICSRCSSHNFKRRDNCYKCQLSRSYAQSVANSPDGSDLIGTTPCNTLVIRDLDALSREDDIINVMQQKVDVKVRQCHVMRDERTHVSRCYGFLELPNVADAYKVVDTIAKSGGLFDIGGKVITVNYAKNTYSTIMASLKAEGSYNAQLAFSRDPNAELVHAATMLSANSNASASQKLAINAVAASGLLNPQAAVAAASSSALAQVQLELQAKQYRQQLAASVHGGAANVPQSTQATTAPALPTPTMPFNPTTCSTTVYPYPDTSSFTYDESTRYYYDPTTGLLYDPNSTYFFDRSSSQYFYWDRIRSLYVRVPPTGMPVEVAAVAALAAAEIGTPECHQPATPGGANTAVNDENELSKKREKENKAKTAKKIAKEMEKWAKRMNSQKEAPATVDKSDVTSSSGSRTADIGCALFEASISASTGTSSASVVTTPYAINIISNAKPALSLGNSGLVPSYGGDDDSDEDLALAIASGAASASSTLPPESPAQPVAKVDTSQPKANAEAKVAEEESKMLDWTKLACLLCSRGFKDVSTLQKHRNFSALHFGNLNKLRAKYDLPPVQPPPTPASGSSASTTASIGNGTTPSSIFPVVPKPGPQTDVPTTTQGGTGPISIESLMQLGAATANNHALNAAARHKIAAEQMNALAQAVYRDRAKERRDRHGTSSPPCKVTPASRNEAGEAGGRNRSECDEPAAQPANQFSLPPAPIPLQSQPPPPVDAASNVGGRLMEKMGWQAGQGLGRANQGRTQIIEAEFRESGVGLGIKPPKRPPPGENYQDNVKRAMFARFHDIE